MNKLIVLIDLHCDASMPSGAEEFGGGNMYARNLIRCLQKADIQFIYITRRKFDFLEEEIQLQNSSFFYRINLGDFSYNDKDLLQNYLGVAIEKITQILKIYANDFEFIFHSFYWQSGLIAKYFARKYHSYFVHSVLSNAERKKLQGAVSDIAEGRIETEHDIFENAKYIICSSKSEYKDLCTLYNINPEKLFVTGRWIAETYRSPSYLSNGATATQPLCQNFPIHYIEAANDCSQFETDSFWEGNSFVFFGRIHENKGLPQIIKAWLDLYQRNESVTPALWIAGGTPQQISRFHSKFLTNLLFLEKAEKQGKIIWWGTLPPEGISTLLLKSKAAIMHSKYEAGGIIVMEAMSQGIPVIATPFGFANDYIVDGENGYLIDFNDIHALTQRMQYFINQPYLSNYLGRKARQISSEIINDWDFLDMHLALYEISKPHNNTKQVLKVPEIIAPGSIDVFPYCYEEPSENFIQYVCSKVLLQKHISILRTIDNHLMCIKWIITTLDATFFFYYFYPVINHNSIFASEKPYVYDSPQRVQQYITCLPENTVFFKDNEKGYLLTTNELEKNL